MTHSSGIFALDFRVYRKPNGHVVIVPPDVDFWCPADYVEVGKVRDIHLDLVCGEIATAKIILYPDCDTTYEAKPKWHLAFPGSPLDKQIKRVEFIDDSEWVPERDFGL